MVNIAAALVIVVAFISRVFVLFWGCYPLDATIYDLDEGGCYGFYGDSKSTFTPACDKPGNVCGEEQERWKTLYDREFHLATTLILASFMLYFFVGFQKRVEYFEITAALKSHKK